MLNIISLSAVRDKITWPGKVVRNLMKWLDILGYPYVLNQALNTTERLWIHDDTVALRYLDKLENYVKPIIGPNLYSLPRNIPDEVQIKNTPYIMPSQWIIDFWKQLGYSGIMWIWATWIDTHTFAPSQNPSSNEVLVYIKKRSLDEERIVLQELEKKWILYSIIRYGAYAESDFQNVLSRVKYVIWLGCAETQGIALEEILSMNIPILVWDITFLGQWTPASKRDQDNFTYEESQFDIVTSVPYFDERCGFIVKSWNEIPKAIEVMEHAYNTYSPREYIIENLSLAGQARAFLGLYETYYNLPYVVWWSNKKQKMSLLPFHNNFFWRSVFYIYDSRVVAYLCKKYLS